MVQARHRYDKIKAMSGVVITRIYVIDIIPNSNAFNYVIADVEADNKTILLDATSQYSAPNIIPVRALNWLGRLILENKTTTDIDLMPQAQSKDIIALMAKIEDNGEITAKMRRNHFDYNAYLFRENYGSVSEDSYLENLEKRYSGIEIQDDYERSNLDDLSKPIVENFSFKSNNTVDIIGDKMYF